MTTTVRRRTAPAASPAVRPADSADFAGSARTAHPAGSARSLIVPAAASGLLMAVYQGLRPYGDVGGGQAALDAFASPMWVVSHVAGLLSLVGFALVALQLADLDGGRLARAARWFALSGMTFSLPAFGAEAFGLHIIGAFGGGTDVGVAMFDGFRADTFGFVFLGLGLLSFAVAGVLVALAWQRRTGSALAWPLGLAVTLVMPAFLVPPVGRMAYGVVFLVASAVFVWDVVRTSRRR